MQKLLVLKFGGQTLSTLKKVEDASKIIKEHHKKYSKIIVIVSAMGSQTNELYAQAKALDEEPQRRELDVLLSTGERISAALLAIACHKEGLMARSFTGSQCQILTDDIHGNARITSIKGERVEEAFKNHAILLIAGFQGVCPTTKEITTLGRGGSDLTAIAMSVRFKADECIIYTDVEGIYSANPKLVNEAKPLKVVSLKAAHQMALAGAKVMHHRAAYLAMINKMPYTVASYLNPFGSNTKISGDQNVEKALVISLAEKKDQTLLKIIGHQPGKDFLTKLWTVDDTPLVFQQIFLNNRYEITCLIASKNKNLLQSSLSGGCVDILQDHLDIINVVGCGFLQNPEIYERLQKIVGTKGLFWQLQDEMITIGVAPVELEIILNSLHQELIFSSST